MNIIFGITFAFLPIPFFWLSVLWWIVWHKAIAHKSECVLQDWGNLAGSFEYLRCSARKGFYVCVGLGLVQLGFALVFYFAEFTP